MRLIGKSELLTLAQSAAMDVRDAVRSLAAVMEAAIWRSASDAKAAFPRAAFADHRLIIELDDRHCVVVAIQYEAGIALVEFAGSTVEWSGNRRPRKGRRS